MALKFRFEVFRFEKKNIGTRIWERQDIPAVEC